MNEINSKSDMIKSFYFNGFVIANLKKSEIHSKFLQTIKELYFNIEKNKHFDYINRNVIDNFPRKEKINVDKQHLEIKKDYEYISDEVKLTNNTVFDQSRYLEFFKENPVFLEILLANRIPNLIETVFGKKMLLTHIAIRKSFKERNLLRKIIKPWGYIGPHRESFIDKGGWKGEAPPGGRVVFYPQLSDKDNTEVKMLEVYPSTHRKMTNFSKGKLIDIFRSFIDKKYSIFQSNNQIAIMNSATRHTVAKENNKQGSIRVLYFFSDPINCQDGTTKLEEMLNEISVSVQQDSLNTIENIKNYY